MNAYVCVYRHKTPSADEYRKTSLLAKRDPLLRRFLQLYEDSYYDWGDDPGFFAAERLLTDVRKASWGVCRRDVRQSLREKDVVVFFCGRQSGRAWNYYFVGVGIVGLLVGRAALWTDPAYAQYRAFYNVLARLEGDKLVQYETFHDFHDDWQFRAEAPYVLFDHGNSAFNLVSPHLVATYNGEVPEKWMDDARAREIEQLLFVERGINRRLRTAETGYGHAKLNLLREGAALRPGRSVGELISALRRLV